MAAPGDRYRVLLIGIDRYPTRALRGCVNDIDAVQRLLLGRLGVPPGRIRRLASPHPGARHEQALPAQEATLANLRAALERLATEARSGDRVLIYYSGHGTRVPLWHDNERSTHREALVPVDGISSPGHVLFDFALNHYLARITARTRSVACILDCCHSAGATRSDGDPDAAPRFLDPFDVAEGLGWPRTIRAPPGTPAAEELEHHTGGAPFELGASAGDCQVVAACMNHENAYETTTGGVRHGRLTRALVQALEEVPTEELHTVRWGQIWQRLRADVERQLPPQRLWMHGHRARAVLAGEPVVGDPGVPVERSGATYRLAAGTLASVTPSTLVAVYGEHPPYFPGIGTPADHAARLGLLRVTQAEPSAAFATVEGRPFDVPAGARGRIVTAGETRRLRCGLQPWSEALAAQLRASPLLEVVHEGAEVCLEVAPDGRWVLTDDLHEPDPATALCVLNRADLHRARELLEHYFAYALPARLAGAVDDKDTLRLRVLESPPAMPASRAQDPDLPLVRATSPELPLARMSGGTSYELPHGAPVCFRVYNAGAAPLRVTLLNPAASGRVILLGSQIIDGRSSAMFWAHGGVGWPFRMLVPEGRASCIDRLLAVGSTLLGSDLSFLRLDRRFSDILSRPRGEPQRHGPDGPQGAAPRAPVLDAEEDAAAIANVERWIATQVVIRTWRRPPRERPHG